MIYPSQYDTADHTIADSGVAHVFGAACAFINALEAEWPVVARMSPHLRGKYMALRDVLERAGR